MKKILSVIFAIMLSMTLVACNMQTSPSQNEQTVDEKLSLVATSFYQYDWLMQVLGEESENFEITLLVDDGTDLHNYQPTAQDMLKITSSDMFIYNGGESDNWVEDVVASNENDNFNAVSVIELLDGYIIQHAGTTNLSDDEHDHEHNEDEHEHDEDEHEHDEDEHEHDEDEHEHHHEHDEHVWLSLQNAIIATQCFADEMSDLDSANKEIYQANADAYIEKLSALDEEYTELVASDVRNVLVFADRFPFAYLLNDYGLSYDAAFEGCSAETEASFETIAWLTEAANDNDIKNLLITEGGTEDIARTIINGMNDKDCDILVLNSMQSITKDMMNSGDTYYSIMKQNLDVIKLALAK